MIERPLIDVMRHELVAGIAHRRRRRRRRRVAASGGVALTLAAALVLAPGARQPTASALAIERAGAWVELRIVDAAAGSDKMTRELQAAGIAAEVRVVPVPAEIAGTWVCVAELPVTLPEPRDTVRLDEVEYTATTIRVASDFADEPHTGRFVFFAGRPANPGEAEQSEPCRTMTR
ncbi:hypothetical protein DVA67_016100 [Solirubrobacter sp. CPCC 204708]|uniref:Uncharacterized protein n=1 Tax=Solirubrobacter deserti TaxID=2282478 RepID=A0ABT4RP28_9ACTN|nr:hypothetical protein [Solirubrobacter deserti]MBE2317506.1 hypothetical protein [Solirubrobacter deserti]MDA0140318.1 hypothetical protein [Solirubrobacter deserti]